MVHNVDILSNPKRAFWNLSSPLILLSIFQACYSLIDMFWVSQLSSEAFFAVGVTAPLFSLIITFGDAVGIGTNSIISRELGKKEYDDTYNSILHGIVACVVLAAVIMSSAFFLKDILALLNVTESVDLAMTYITPIFIFSFVFLFSSLFVNTLQAEGNSRIPTRLLILTNVLNLILDPLLIFVFNWGIIGASYATIISTSIAVIFFLYWYLSGKSEVVLNFKYFKPGIIYDIFVVAVPNFIMDGLWCVSMMYFNRILIEQLGSIGVLLYATSLNIESFIVSPEIAFGKAALTISGHLYGAEDYDKLKEIYRYSLIVSISLVIVTAIAFFFVRDYVFGLFSVTNVEKSVFYIALVGIFLLPCEQVIVMSNKILDGMGKSYHSLILSNGTIIFEIILTTLLAPILTQGVCVLMGIFITELIFAVAYFILIQDMLKGKNRLEERIQSKKNNSI
ncbi:MATE family efflux transporter [Methanobrevibacter sp.]